MSEINNNSSSKKLDPIDEVRMSFGEHLDELRSRLLKCIYGVLVGLAICLYFGDEIFSFLAQPLVVSLSAANMEQALYAAKLPETFLTYIKVSLYAGIFLVSPWVLYQLWAFVSAGLYAHEKRYVRIVMPFSAVLFLLGGAFFITIVAPISCSFFISFGTNMSAPEVSKDSWTYKTLVKFYGSKSESEDDTDVSQSRGSSLSVKIPSGVPYDKIKLLIDGQSSKVELRDAAVIIPNDKPGRHISISFPVGEGETTEINIVTDGAAGADETDSKARPLVKPWFTLQNYVSLIIVLSLSFGVAFQMPLVVFFLGRLSLVRLKTLKSVRKYVFFVIVVIAAMITPPDVISQIAMAIPMYLLYELGLLLLRFWPGRKRSFD